MPAILCFCTQCSRLIIVVRYLKTLLNLKELNEFQRKVFDWLSLYFLLGLWLCVPLTTNTAVSWHLGYTVPISQALHIIP
jgi:hypothetical protein